MSVLCMDRGFFRQTIVVLSANYFHILIFLKSSRNKKDFNDVSAVPFLVSFSQLPAAKKKHQRGGSCDVIKVLLICDDFNQVTLAIKFIKS